MAKSHSRFGVAGQWLVLSAMAVLGVCGSARADVLGVMPSDPLMVIRFKNVGEFSKKLADLSASLGVAELNPQMADPMATFKGQLGVSEGLNEAGQAAIVMVNVADEATFEKGPLVVLLPVSDYAAFIGNFAGAETEGDVTRATIGGSADPAYIKQWGEYAAISPIKELVETQGAGLKLPKAALAAADKDAMLFANFPVLKGKLLPSIEAAKADLKEDFIEGVKATPQGEPFAPVMEVLFDTGIKAAETFLNESQGSFVGVNITPVGVNLTIASEFSAGSYIGSLASSLTSSTDTLLAGLPASSYLFYGGVVATPAAMVKLSNDILEPLVAALPADKPEAKELTQKFLAAANRATSAGQSGAFGMIKPKGQLGAESIVQSVAVIKGDAPTYVANTIEVYTSMGPVIRAYVPEAAEIPGLDYTVEAGSVDAGGVKLDRVKMVVPEEPKTPEEAQMQQMMSLMYGPSGLSYVIGAIDANTALYSQGLSEELLAASVESAKSGADSIATLAHVKETSDELPAKKIAVFYIAVDEIANTAVTYISQFGMPVPFQLPPNLPPVGIAYSANGETIQADVHIPTKLVQSIVAASLQTMQNMQGGGGGL